MNWSLVSFRQHLTPKLIEKYKDNLVWVYTSKFKWSIGNIVGHMYKLIDEYLAFHNEDSDYFMDRSIDGFSYDPIKEEIHIEDQS